MVSEPNWSVLGDPTFSWILGSSQPCVYVMANLGEILISALDSSGTRMMDHSRFNSRFPRCYYFLEMAGSVNQWLLILCYSFADIENVVRQE